MTNLHKKVSELLNKAEWYLEKEDFINAKIHYQKAVLLEMPDEVTLTNMHVAHDYEFLEFSEKMSELYPDDFEVRYAEVRYYNRVGQPKNAAILCTSLLPKFQDQLKYYHKLRSYRYLTAILSRRYFDTLADDFLYLWSSAMDNDNGKRAQALLIERLAQVSSLSIIPILEELKKSDKLQSSEVQKFFVNKINELKSLALFKREMGISD